MLNILSLNMFSLCKIKIKQISPHNNILKTFKMGGKIISLVLKKIKFKNHPINLIDQ